MLPPFVPPSARVPSEPLPLITEFVIERTVSAAAAETATATIEAPEAPEALEAPGAPEAPRAWTSESEVPLPSIEEFLFRRPTVEEPAAAVAEPVPPELPATESREPAAQVDTALAMSAQDESPVPASEETPPGAIFNDEAGAAEVSTPGVTAAEAWTASSMSAAAVGAESVEDRSAEAAPAPRVAPTEAPAEEWVADERDAFDWQRVAGLASSPDEARRAAEEWAATSWDRGHRSEQEHVAAALVQIARRIRAGELKVEVPQQATAEASLAAVLAALLADGDR